MEKKKNLLLRPRIVFCAVLLLAAAGGLSFFLLRPDQPVCDPLYTTIEEDPCYRDGVFSIYNKKDYIRFVGYLNRANKEEKDNPAALAIDAELMADINLEEDKGYGRLKGHPYIRDTIFHYRGTFTGNGHTITWYADSPNSMFTCVDRGAVLREFTFRADSIISPMDEYGVGMLCMINYGEISDITTEGRIESAACYVGGIAGINRGAILNCVNRAEVVLSGIGSYGAGGIAGLNKCIVLEGEDEANPVPAILRGCVNLGAVNAPWEAGGICAYNDCASIYDCGNEGAVTVRYQKVHPDPEHPDRVNAAMAAGICGHMGWNSIENCYNTGKISILEEGTEATYAIAGNTLLWINTVSGCVSLKGCANGRMRHESVMELDEDEMELWQKDHNAIPYLAANWQFCLEEAKEKLPLAPLGVTESPRTDGRQDVYLCEEFCFQAPEGYSITEVSPYALRMENRAEDPDSLSGGYQVWLLRLEDGIADASDYFSEEGYFTADTAHEVWLDITGSHWLHPAGSWEADNHVEYFYSWLGPRWLQTNFCMVHYRDDFLAEAAVGENGEMIDNVTVIPAKRSSDGSYEIKWMLLFTNRNNNYRPALHFVQEVLSGFLSLPCEITVQSGDTLSALSEECTGDANRYPELAAYNRLPDANRIYDRQLLRIPEEWLPDLPVSD